MKTRRICKDFLKMRKGLTYDAIAAAQDMNEVWGIKVDWHEMDYALQDLESSGEAERVFVMGCDRITCYTIKVGKES